MPIIFWGPLPLISIFVDSIFSTHRLFWRHEISIRGALGGSRLSRLDCIQVNAAADRKHVVFSEIEQTLLPF